MTTENIFKGCCVGICAILWLIVIYTIQAQHVTIAVCIKAAILVFVIGMFQKD